MVDTSYRACVGRLNVDLSISIPVLCVESIVQVEAGAAQENGEVSPGVRRTGQDIFQAIEFRPFLIHTLRSITVNHLVLESIKRGRGHEQ